MTGVQTCALPISGRTKPQGSARFRPARLPGLLARTAPESSGRRPDRANVPAGRPGHHQRGRKLLFESRQVDFCLLNVVKGYSLELGTHGRDYTLRHKRKFTVQYLIFLFRGKG